MHAAAAVARLRHGIMLPFEVVWYTWMEHPPIVELGCARSIEGHRPFPLLLAIHIIQHTTQFQEDNY